jgi:hypothetical protein
MFFRRKGPVQPLVVENCWPTKKERLGGFRKKRNVQIMFGVDQTMQNEPVINDAMETEALADVEMEAVDVAKEVNHVNDDILLLKKVSYAGK